MSEPRKFVVSFPDLGLSTDPDCAIDPCEKHGTCHCNCVCMPDGDDNCRDCAEAFES